MAVAASRYRAWRAITHPAVALPLWLASYYVWHVPAVYDAALRHQSSLIHLEHACYFGPACSSGGRSSRTCRAAWRAASAPATPSPRSCSLRRSGCCSRSCHERSTRYYEHAPRLWGLTPLADQELAGATMAAEQAVVLFAVFAYWFRRFLAEEGAASYWRQPTTSDEVGVAAGARARA